MLRRWLAHHVGPDATTIRIASSRRGRGGEQDALSAALGDSPKPVYLIPLRVVWMAPGKDGRRSVAISDVFKPGDPRDPKGLRALWIRTMAPKRVKFVAAQGALVSELAVSYASSGQVDPLEGFVTGRAWRVLDKAERQIRGNRYKIPRFVPEAILSRREFLDAVAAVAKRTGASPESTRARAERYLREIAATHSPYVIDMIAAAIHKLYGLGYGSIKYSEDEVRKIALLGQEHPVVFLPSHRSNLDRLSLQFLLWENDLPPNHTAGGINLNFFPVGPLVRRTGVFFIRRSFRDDDLYKTVLKSYLDYLVEKRFPLEWYVEGGRSRSGKLLPPRLGLLSYVVDAQLRGKSDDVLLIPVSIAYDQIQDVPGYAREAEGMDKEKESLGWLFRTIRSLRRRYGDIHVRFGEPVSVRASLDSADSTDESSVELQKMAFEVLYRIGQVTPVTPTALMSIALLAARGSARSASQLAEECASIAEFLMARGVALTEVGFEHGNAQMAARITQGLVDNGYVSSHEALGRRVFWLDESQMIKISYYRNMVVHFFVPRAFSEMALSALGHGSDFEMFHERLLEFRDLLKFEFFFPEKEAFLDKAAADLAIDLPAWEQLMTEIGANGVVARLGDRVAHWALLPFLDAYQIVGDELEALRGPFIEKTFLKACLARARMYRIEERLISGESASQVLFKSALSLAENRRLLVDRPEVRAERAHFAAEVRSARELAAIGL